MTNKNVKVSVIVPVYNVEKYIKECLDSLVKQSLKEIEIICINDGSTDHTEEILCEYSHLDKRINTIFQENAGAAAARNSGLRLACGEYVYFMDADDILREDALEILYVNAIKHRLDVLYFDGQSFFETEQLKESMQSYQTYYIRKGEYSDVMSGKEMFVKMVDNNEYRVSPCLQFIRREYQLENKLFFHEGVYYEDNAFSLSCILSAKQVFHIREQLFMRRVRENSVMTKAPEFAHAYGYFVGFLDIMEIGKTCCMSESEQYAVSKIIGNMLESARHKYHELCESEKKKYLNLSVFEKKYFNLWIERYDKIVREKEKLENDVRKIEQLKIEACEENENQRVFISELKAELFELEKNNQNLQYKQNELYSTIKAKKKTIKQLKKDTLNLKSEIERIRQSRSYRIGCLFTRPFRWLKIFIKTKK